MYEKKPLSEVKPECRLVWEHKPPIGKRLWLITKYGTGFAGDYHPEWGVVAWSPLPKLTEEQKVKIQDYINEEANSKSAAVSLPTSGCCTVPRDELLD